MVESGFALPRLIRCNGASSPCLESSSSRIVDAAIPLRRSWTHSTTAEPSGLRPVSVARPETGDSTISNRDGADSHRDPFSSIQERTAYSPGASMLANSESDRSLSQLCPGSIRTICTGMFASFSRARWLGRNSSLEASGRVNSNTGCGLLRYAGSGTSIAAAPLFAIFRSSTTREPAIQLFCRDSA